MQLFYSPGACSLAPHIMLEEVGAPFEPVRVAIAQGEQLRPEFLEINPRGRVPALRDGDFVLTEAPAILGYLGRRFPDAGMLPPDLRDFARCGELLAFFSNSVHVAVAQVWRPGRFTLDASVHNAIKAGGTRNLLAYFGEIEQLAGAESWLVAGCLTVADLYPFVFYRWGLRMGHDMTVYAHWSAHTERMLARPAVIRALATEGLNASEFRHA